MTEFEQRPDKGRLMAAQSKKNERSPDYWGELAINPKDMTNVTIENGMHIYKISGWKTKSKAGNTYLSLSVKRIEAEGATPPPKADISDDDLPF
jgi:hypothetical protein